MTKHTIGSEESSRLREAIDVIFAYDSSLSVKVRASHDDTTEILVENPYNKENNFLTLNLTSMVLDVEAQESAHGIGEEMEIELNCRMLRDLEYELLQLVGEWITTEEEFHNEYMELLYKMKHGIDEHEWDVRL